MNLDITLTPIAQQHIIDYLQKQGARGVRFSVKKTGCSGLSYVVDYVAQEEPTDKCMVLDDKFLICIDYKSYPYLKGMTVDYVKKGLNQKFVFTNPNQVASCGCGESFMVSEPRA